MHEFEFARLYAPARLPAETDSTLFSVSLRWRSVSTRLSALLKGNDANGNCRRRHLELLHLKLVDDAGHADAQYQFSCRLQNGIGCSSDCANDGEYLHQSANIAIRSARLRLLLTVQMTVILGKISFGWPKFINFRLNMAMH
jgi:hypothetical protein